MLRTIDSCFILFSLVVLFHAFQCEIYSDVVGFDNVGSDFVCFTDSSCCIGGTWQTPCNLNETWSNWSICVGDCSGGVRKRGRQICCPTPDDYDDCAQKCNLPLDVGTESQNCTNFCCPQGGCFESNVCYPGRCGYDGCSYCECAPNFAGDSCRTITRPPDTEGCSAVVWLDAQPGEGVLTVPCEFPGPVTRSTRLPLDNVDLTWIMKFEGPNITLYPFPTEPYSYIDEFRVGIIKAKLDVTTYIAGDHISETNDTESCPGNPSPENPVEHSIDCSQILNLGLPWQHGNSLKLDLIAESGGHIAVTDRPSGLQCIKPYSQEATGRTITIHHDIHKPIHTPCPGCEPMMMNSDVYTKSCHVNVSWGGWEDLPAGIGGYKLSAYRLEVQPDQSLKAPADPVTEAVFSNDQQEGSIPLTGPGMYSIILTINDKCEPVANQQVARRFVLYDDVSHVIGVPWQSLVVISASPQTHWTWILTESDGTDFNAPLSVMWGNHFENRIQLDNSWLNNIQTHDPPVPPEYDMLEGQPPQFRSAQRVVNARGIIRWEFLVVRNPSSKESLTNPDPEGDWNVVDIFDYDPMSGTTRVARTDGDVIAFVVRGYDVVDNFHNSYVISYVDSSPPHVEDLRFTRNGEIIHNVTDPTEIFELKLQFAALDLSSGLDEIMWEIRDRQFNLLHASGSTPVKLHTGGPSTCHVLQHCYCTNVDWGNSCFYFNYEIQPSGNELIPPGNYLYYYRVIVTNGANLVTVVEHDLDS